MFKSKEELKETRCGLTKVGIDDAFKSFAERKEFYEKYRDKPEYFTKILPRNEWWAKNRDEYKKLNNTMIPASRFYEEHLTLQHLIKGFNNWLFEYCFGDVIE